MEPEVFLPTKLQGHVTKHCSHVVNNPGINNNIECVYTIQKKTIWRRSNFFEQFSHMRRSQHPLFAWSAFKKTLFVL